MSIFEATCRRCDKDIRLVVGSLQADGNNAGIHVRCGGCGRTNWATKRTKAKEANS